MRIAAIYNIWCGDELLSGSVDCIKEHVDLIIFVYQDVSNFGEKYSPLPTISKITLNCPTECLVIQYHPAAFDGAVNETAKRNLGIKKAREAGCTHFVHLDCDEYWEDFKAAKEEFISSGCISSVAQMWTYFKRPNLRLANPEGYYVPFITELDSNTVVGRNAFPYYCDPTRKPFNPSEPNKYTMDNVHLMSQKMHHFSYIRNDIFRKIRNSSARNNLQKSTIVTDYHSPDIGHGFYVKFFEQKLCVTKNIFGITVSQ